MQQSAEHYKACADEWIHVDSCPEYLLKVEARLAEESKRVHLYLQPSTEEKLMSACERELLQQHQVGEAAGSGWH